MCSRSRYLIITKNADHLLAGWGFDDVLKFLQHDAPGYLDVQVPLSPADEAWFCEKLSFRAASHNLMVSTVPENARLVEWELARLSNCRPTESLFDGVSTPDTEWTSPLHRAALRHLCETRETLTLEVGEAHFDAFKAALGPELARPECVVEALELIADFEIDAVALARWRRGCQAGRCAADMDCS